MRYVFVLVCLLMVLTASVANAVQWTTSLTDAFGGPGYIQVVTTATDNTTYWSWSYAVTPKNGATGINALTIWLGDAKAALVTGITVPTGWSGTVNVLPGNDSVEWRTDPNSATFNPLNAGNTFTFAFDHPWGPSASPRASVLDSTTFIGQVRGPSAPEPMSVLLGIMGLGSVAGFRKLRRK